MWGLLISAAASLAMALLYGFLEFFKFGDKADGRALALVYFFINSIIIWYYIFELRVIEIELLSIVYVLCVLCFQGMRLYFENSKPKNRYIDEMKGWHYNPVISAFISTSLFLSAICLVRFGISSEYLVFGSSIFVLISLVESHYIVRDLFLRDFEFSRKKIIEKEIVLDYIKYVIFAKLLKGAIYIYISCVGLIWGVSRVESGSFSYENCSNIKETCNISLTLSEAFFFSISQGIGGTSRFFPVEASAQMASSFVSVMGLFVTSVVLLFALNIRQLIGVSAPPQ